MLQIKTSFWDTLFLLTWIEFVLRMTRAACIWNLSVIEQWMVSVSVRSMFVCVSWCDENYKVRPGGTGTDIVWENEKTDRADQQYERESWDLGHILAILVLECHIYNIDNTHSILCTWL